MISAPVARTSSGINPFTVACVPTGMKAGVWTEPCGVTSSPRRAAPSVFSTRKEKGRAIRQSYQSGHIRDPSCRYAIRIKQARIPVGIEPVPVGNRMRIGLLYRIEPAESRYQHEQRRARQMKVCQHQIDSTKFISRRYENLGFPRIRL